MKAKLVSVAFLVVVALAALSLVGCGESHPTYKHGCMMWSYEQGHNVHWDCSYGPQGGYDDNQPQHTNGIVIVYDRVFSLCFADDGYLIFDPKTGAEVEQGSRQCDALGGSKYDWNTANTWGWTPPTAK
jgi:hypothetical protein